eukprot:COSAG03_NODE_4800_length_1428_cov_2.521445_3_plen_104_part_00
MCLYSKCRLEFCDLLRRLMKMDEPSFSQIAQESGSIPGAAKIDDAFFLGRQAHSTHIQNCRTPVTAGAQARRQLLLPARVVRGAVRRLRNEFAAKGGNGRGGR